MDTLPSNEELHDFPETSFISRHGHSRRLGCTFDKPALVRNLQKCMRSWVMFRYIAFLLGLWNPRRSWWRVLFILIFLLGDVYRCVQTVIYAFVCPDYSSILDSNILDTLFCAGNKTRNTSSVGEVQIPLKFHIDEASLLIFVLAISQLLSHLTFFWSVWVLPKRENCVSQENTLTLVKASEWTKLNYKMGFSVIALILIKLLLFIEVNQQFSPNNFVGHVAHCITQWSSLMTCWIFCTFISSLESLTFRCLDDIMTSQHLNDIIRHHQKLCKIIFGTSNAFKLWFMMHWVVYTATCVLWAANFIFYFKLYSQGWCYVYGYITTSAIFIYVFIYPCYRAAALTEKCQQMLADFNMTTEQDWHSTHPFHNRSQLHLFLQYANYANCGYKVGRLTFSSMSVFFSTLLAIVGFGLKIF